MPENIGGTVIQRSFVGADIPNVIHIASVPTEELEMGEASLQEIVTQTLGVPRHVALTGEEYSKIVRTIVSRGPLFLYPWLHPRLEERYFRIIARSEGEGAQWFVGSFLSLLTAPDAGASLLPFLTQFPLIDDEFRGLDEIPTSRLHTALACLASHAARPPEVEAFFQAILGYEIPIGQSPAVRSDSLGQLLTTTKKACIAPLAIGGTYAMDQLHQGQYVMALLQLALQVS